MEVRFWGTRGSIAAPGPATVRYGGNTTCVEILLESGERVILDAGSGIRPLGRALARAGGPVECHLLITHIHWDHIMGFPFFAPIYMERTRIWIDGCARAMEGLRMTLNKGMVDGVFPVEFDSLRSRMEPLCRLGGGELGIGGALVDGIELRHPQGGMGFRIREGNRTLVFLTDNELLAHPANGRSRTDYVRFCQGADLLIHDAQYLPQEMDSKRGWGHSDCISAVELALEAGASRLLLTHHDPDRLDQDVDELVSMAVAHAEAGGSGLQVEGAREGQVLRI
jgi:phosphoribosyl 1,2-cyclic phosphodiesterase